MSKDDVGTISFPQDDDTPKKLPAYPAGADPTECNVTRASLFPRVRVIIDESSDPSDQQNSTVSVNGRAYQFLRGAEIALPPEAIEALEHATVIKHYQAQSGPNKGELVARPTQRYPFRILDEEGHRTMRLWREWHEQRRAA